MLTALEKAKALKEFRELRLKLAGDGLTALDKAKSLKRFRELRLLLGGQNQPEAQEPANNPLYQSILEGREVTLELLEQVKAEAEKDLNHPQLIPAVLKLKEQVEPLQVHQSEAA
ncbi:hypothetical protein [Alkanindiges illinoisensis]|uniref:hypothetical protein n=1 Tax=Alkanindiges illinoisensis TaxID=197183 RepID=UPI00068627C2|nr:hypothetical protein [Alkanindiges illinoisensis]